MDEFYADIQQPDLNDFVIENENINDLLIKISEDKINHKIYDLMRDNIELPHDEICNILRLYIEDPEEHKIYLLLREIVTNPRKDKICFYVQQIIEDPKNYEMYTLLRNAITSQVAYGIDKKIVEPFSSCKGCIDYNTNNPMKRLQIQKVIQKVVRVPSSLYYDNLNSVNVFQKPLYYNHLNWNQSSDRLACHHQYNIVPSHCNTTKSTKTSIKPGACSPGGLGVDIKHNSYARYLFRLKGKGPYKKDIIPKEQIYPELPYNRAFPIHGDKLVKLNIINNCIMPCGCKKS